MTATGPASSRRGFAAPERLVSARLEYRRPAADVEPIFRRYASDAEVTRYMGWARPSNLHDTRVFLDFSHNEWRQWGCGPYLLFHREDGELLGSTGIGFDTPDVASTGYVLARDAWGHGYATEALLAMRDLAPTLGIRRLYAICHLDHAASRRVMEKGGFHYEGVVPRRLIFPNLSPDRQDVHRYAIEFAPPQE